jgi:hypothetical protein
MNYKLHYVYFLPTEKNHSSWKPLTHLKNVVFRRVRKVPKINYLLHHNSAPTRTDLYEISYVSVYRKSVEKIQVWLKYDKNNGYFTRSPICIFIVSRPVLLTIIYVSEKSCRENQNTHFVFNHIFPRVVCVYDIMWKNRLESNRPQMTI